MGVACSEGVGKLIAGVAPGGGAVDGLIVAESVGVAAVNDTPVESARQAALSQITPIKIINLIEVRNT